MAAHPAEDFVGNRAAPGRVVVGGDAGAEEGDFVAEGGVRGVVGDVDQGEVHADTAEDRGLLVVDHDPAIAEAGGGFAAEAVGVTDREEGGAERGSGGESGAVAYGVAGVEVAEAGDAGFPGGYGVKVRGEVGSRAGTTRVRDSGPGGPDCSGEGEGVAIEGQTGTDEGCGADFVEAEVTDPGEGGAFVDGGTVAKVEVVGEELAVL